MAIRRLDAGVELDILFPRHLLCHRWRHAP
jgi:hypothetical protein